MRVVRAVSCAAFGALALAACSKPPAPHSSAPAVASAAPSAAAAPVSAQQQATGAEIPASQMPLIRAGLWETTETLAGHPPHADRSCESGKRQPMSMGKACQTLTVHRTALGGYAIDSACGFGDTQLDIHVAAMGDFQTSWSADVTSHIKMPGKPEQVDTSHKQARYLGPCPAGMQATG